MLLKFTSETNNKHEAEQLRVTGMAQMPSIDFLAVLRFKPFSQKHRTLTVEPPQLSLSHLALSQHEGKKIDKSIDLMNTPENS